MAVDQATVRRIAHLARIKLTDADVPHLAEELNSILAFVEELSSVDVSGVEPMTSVMPMHLYKRPDVINDGNIPDEIVANAPATEDHFFVVPKVVE
jgi:aspartyl-tRNA(Asn)/glutamyl-tRNA(Gln) amidotransferase subunit C